MAWRMARSVEVLRKQINELAPNRSILSDGGIGDEDHSSRDSDHNPNEDDVVCARDFTHDPAHGFDSWAFAELLRVKRDPRIKYVISNGRIFAGPEGPSPWQWRRYTGKNKHAHHVHVSVGRKTNVPSLYDDAKLWDIKPGQDAPKYNENASAPKDQQYVRLRKGVVNRKEVLFLQAKLGFSGNDLDGIFGPKTDKAVRDFQRAHDLDVDGIVGGLTWEALLKATKEKGRA